MAIQLWEKVMGLSPVLRHVALSPWGPTGIVSDLSLSGLLCPLYLPCSFMISGPFVSLHPSLFVCLLSSHYDPAFVKL